MTSFSIPTIETDRLILRAHSAQDFDDLAALWADPWVVRFINGTPSTRTESWNRLLRYAGMWPVLGYGYWCVTTHDGQFLGEVGFANFQRDLTPSIADTPEAGWVMTQSSAGQGFATEAMQAAHRWADTRFPKTVALFDPDHTASQNVARKLGYTRAHIADFAGRDTLVMARSVAQ